jgi:formate hydrogenlyase subunit 6/NADH:ubiquinone oxidoreductase subunit I
MKKPGKMLSETMKHVLKRPATIRYPYVKVEMPAKFRGKIKFHSDKCIGCKACMRDCPSKVINIIKVADKKFEAEFLNDRCVFCAQCVDTCPKDALEATVEFELATFDRKNLKTHFYADLTPKPDAEPEGPKSESAPEDPAPHKG